MKLLFTVFVWIAVCIPIQAEEKQSNQPDISSAYSDLYQAYNNLTAFLKKKELTDLLKRVDESQKLWDDYFLSQKKLADTFNKGPSKFVAQQQKALLVIIQVRTESLIGIYDEIVPREQ